MFVRLTIAESWVDSDFVTTVEHEISVDGKITIGISECKSDCQASVAEERANYTAAMEYVAKSVLASLEAGLFMFNKVSVYVEMKRMRCSIEDCPSLRLHKLVAEKFLLQRLPGVKLVNGPPGIPEAKRFKIIT